MKRTGPREEGEHPGGPVLLDLSLPLFHLEIGDDIEATRKRSRSQKQAPQAAHSPRVGETDDAGNEKSAPSSRWNHTSKRVIIGHSLILNTPSRVLNLDRMVFSMSAKLLPFIRAMISYFPSV